MSFDFYYDETSKDITLTTEKDLKFTSDIFEYTTQKIEKVFLVILGEWYLNRDEGLPYIAQKNNDRDNNTKNIFVKNPDLIFINGIMRNKLKNISTIDSIITFNSELNTSTRQLDITFTVQLINGDLYTDTVGIGVF